MDSITFLIIFWLLIALGQLIAIVVLLVKNAHLKQQLADALIRELMYSKQTLVHQSALLEQIRHQTDRPHAVEQLMHSHEERIASLHKQFPALTDTDVQVLLLLGMRIDNQDIILLLDMSKRTYYKRRQLIAKRMNIATEKLDETAQTLFNPKY